MDACSTNPKRTFVIEYTPCPTSFNNPRKMTTEDPADSLVYESSTGFTLALKNHSNVVVDMVYVETGSEKQIHYKDRGYGEPHVSEELKALIKRPLKEVLV